MERMSAAFKSVSNAAPDPREMKGWYAALELGFENRAERTVLSRRHHIGPLRVQRPFYPEGNDVCHVVVLHPPGGVVGGDELDIAVNATYSANALITTPAAGKFYRSGGATARQRQTLSVARGAAVEWLPQETIVFDGAQAEVATRVELEQGANFLGWEITCMGRPAANEKFEHGTYQTRFEIWREGRPLFMERTHLEGGEAVLSAAWGMAGYSVTGVLVCVSKDSGMVDTILGAVAPASDGDHFSVTQLSDVLVCRYLGNHTERAKVCFTQAWQLLRPAVLQRQACRPRIWDT